MDLISIKLGRKREDRGGRHISRARSDSAADGRGGNGGRMDGGIKQGIGNERTRSYNSHSVILDISPHRTLHELFCIALHNGIVICGILDGEIGSAAATTVQ